MIQKKLIKQLFTASLVFISRFGFLPANVSPLGSFGFFSQNIWLYFITIIAFDLLKSGLYPGFLFTYLGFATYYLYGKLTHHQLKRQLILLPLASFSFFLISNFGVWLYWYPKTLIGLSNCYLNALPFYRQTLLGDLLFGFGFKTLLEILNNKSILNEALQKNLRLPN